MKEITLEITDYCPHECLYCSTKASLEGSNYLSLKQVKDIIKDEIYDRINISGGEPLANPDFYKILRFCESRSKSYPAIYSNAIRWIFYNANVIDGIRVEANLNIPDNVQKVHILKRVKQGREKTRPEVHFSSNWDECKEDCSQCTHRVVRPNGTVSMGPCRKEVDEGEPRKNKERVIEVRCESCGNTRNLEHRNPEQFDKFLALCNYCVGARIFKRI